MNYQCLECEWLGDWPVEYPYSELVDDMHDRAPTLETFVDLYCPNCGAEVDNCDAE